MEHVQYTNRRESDINDLTVMPYLTWLPILLESAYSARVTYTATLGTTECVVSASRSRTNTVKKKIS